MYILHLQSLKLDILYIYGAAFRENFHSLYNGNGFYSLYYCHSAREVPGMSLMILQWYSLLSVQFPVLPQVGKGTVGTPTFWAGVGPFACMNTLVLS